MTERINRDFQVFNEHLEAASEDKGYIELVTDTADQLPMMSEGCRLAINIPARQEERRVYDTLSMMLVNTSGGPKQHTLERLPLDPALYEVTIFDNWDMYGSHDGTSEQVRRFMHDYPHIPVRLISAGLPSRCANVGFARRVLQDVTAMRSLRRSCASSGPLYIASEDADNEGFDSYAIAAYIKYLDDHPDAIGAKMRMAMNLVTLSQVPHRFMDHRMVRITNFLMQRAGPLGSCSQRENENGFCSRYSPPDGVGVAYTAADMLEVGGYLNGVCAEDFSLWSRLHTRENERGNDGLRLHTLPTYTVTSPRRLLASYVSDVAMYGVNADFLSLHDAIRQPESWLVAEAKAKYSLEEQRAVTQDELSKAAHYTLSRHATPEQRWHNVGKLMLGMGFGTSDYMVQDKEPEVIVRNWEEVEGRILQYKPNRRMRQSMNITV